MKLRDILKDFDSKLNRLNDKQTELVITATEQKVILKEHIRRTELNEKRIEKLEDFYRKFAIGLLLAGGGFLIKMFLEFLVR